MSWVLSGKYFNKFEINPSKTLVFTTPCPRIKREITVISEVLLKPFKIL